jgi:hypothetical protein
LDTASILARFKQAVQAQQIKISLHAAEEALSENIARPDIEKAMMTAQFLEDYPDWWLGPCCLIWGQTDSGRDLHLVLSYSEPTVTVVTVYEPKPPRWDRPNRRGRSEP